MHAFKEAYPQSDVTMNHQLSHIIGGFLEFLVFLLNRITYQV